MSKAGSSKRFIKLSIHILLCFMLKGYTHCFCIFIFFQEISCIHYTCVEPSVFGYVIPIVSTYIRMLNSNKNVLLVGLSQPYKELTY